MSLLKDAERLRMAIRDDEQARGFDASFAELIARIANQLELIDEQLDRKVDKPYQR